MSFQNGSLPFKTGELEQIKLGTLQQIMGNTSSLYMTQLARKQPNNFQLVSKLIELKSISKTYLISLYLQLKSSTCR